MAIIASKFLVYVILSLKCIMHLNFSYRIQLNKVFGIVHRLSSYGTTQSITSSTFRHYEFSTTRQES